MGINRRGFLRSAAVAAAAPARPNIVYIMTDQQHAGMMSCTGNRWLQTPHMDRLAASGTRFELAYSGNPVCMPARTSMMTGRYPSHFGMRSNGPAVVPEAALSKALGHVFRAGGYRTAFGGKTHWPKPMTAESIGFEYISRDERDGLAEACVRFLKSPQEKPFLLVASFINPHDICYMAIDAHTKAEGLPTALPKSVVEREYVAKASRVTGPVPPLPANHGPTAGEPGAFTRLTGFRKYVRAHWGEAEWRLHRWTYCRLTEGVDAEIGKVLAAVDKDTVVIFSSDHGDMDSAHGFEHKSLPYEESARVPFVVSWPGRVPAGKVDRKHLVGSTIDLFPTLCDFAGIRPPEGLPGRSVRGLAERGSEKGWRTDLVVECGDSRMLRSGRYKYSIWEGPGTREMLIDMEKDPGEMRNLAGEKGMASVVAEHRARLRAEIMGREDAYGRELLGGL
jgi:arylsulfatase A-like enzyme